MKKLIMRYNSPAIDSDYGWENESLPLGNGFTGANVFGIVERERVQITHNALVNPQYYNGKNFGGLNNLAEVYIHFPHKDYENYERGLSLNNAVSYVNYTHNGVDYKREYFASYPDRVVVMHFSSSKPGALSFDLKPEIPFIKEFALEAGDGGGKSGSVYVSDYLITLKGKLEFFNVRFECQIKLFTDGKISKTDNGLSVFEATDATVVFAADTNYELTPNAFLEDDPKKKIPDIDPHNKVSAIMESAKKFNYEELKKRHIEDYSELFGRVELSLGDDTSGFVPELMECYKNGEDVPYLEELYFQFGRYLLISSSRKGGLPANLQGIWNCHDFSPWGSGYWHNINVQMNYWPAFNTNLLETFDAYVDFNKAYRPSAEKIASEYIKKHNPENYIETPGECGWTIGTGSYPYFIQAPGRHSGPGTGGLTTKLFWEYYDFSRDKQILKDVTYPALLGMSKFLTKTVKDYDGEYLVSYSASPEQVTNGRYIYECNYYHTVGCAFDQQMLYENGKDLIKSAEILGEDNETVRLQKKQLDHYSPVLVGWSGQIKEYWEERFYGEIGEYEHRHISQLMSLHPGTVITSKTPAWIDASKFSLTERGNNSTGWALGHRLNAWARTGDGDSAYEVLRKMLSEKTMINLWDLHPPFQIDGNFGATAGVAEMLLQSHNGCLEILPALPEKWKSGSFRGLLARGAFEVSAKWESGCATEISVLSKKGGTVCVKYKNISKASGCQFEVIDDDTVSVETTVGEVYVFKNIPVAVKVPEVLSFDVTQNLELKWESDLPVNIYRAFESEPVYKLVAENIQGGVFVDDIDFSKYETVTYKVKNVSSGFESCGLFKTVNHSTQKERDRYRHLIKQLNYLVIGESN